LFIAYVDDSGIPVLGKDTPYYVLSLLLLHETDMTGMKRFVDDYKKKYFKGSYANSEIHTHDIFKAKKDFYGLKPSEITILLDNLYNLIKDLPVKIICVAINKNTVKKHDLDLVAKSWEFLAERFDGFLENDVSPNKGVVRIDKSCRDQEKRVMNIVNRLRRHGSSQQTIKNIVEEPVFYRSHERRGLQLADAVAYCAHRHLNNRPDFDKYWKILEDKLWTNKKGNYNGYGLKIFPP